MGLAPPRARGRLAVLVTDQAAAQFLIQRLDVYAEARGLTVEIETPAAALSPKFLHDTGAPLGAVVIPGARSSQAFRYYLGVKGFTALRQYVEAGGSIIGICQGFYLLSSDIYYMDTLGRSKSSRENLNLLPGVTVGDIRHSFNPVARGFAEGWANTAVVATSFHQHASSVKPMSCFYWGGPFYLPEKNQDVRPIAQYLESSLAGKLIAAAERRVGKGLVIGLGPHLEISSKMVLSKAGANLFDCDNSQLRQQIAQQLAPDDSRRAAVFDALVDHALTTPYGRTCRALSSSPSR